MTASEISLAKEETWTETTTDRQSLLSPKSYSRTSSSAKMPESKWHSQICITTSHLTRGAKRNSVTSEVPAIRSANGCFIKQWISGMTILWNHLIWRESMMMSCLWVDATSCKPRSSMLGCSITEIVPMFIIQRLMLLRMSIISWAEMPDVKWKRLWTSGKETSSLLMWDTGSSITC